MNQVLKTEDKVQLLVYEPLIIKNIEVIQINSITIWFKELWSLFLAVSSSENKRWRNPKENPSITRSSKTGTVRGLRGFLSRLM